MATHNKNIYNFIIAAVLSSTANAQIITESFKIYLRNSTENIVSIEDYDTNTVYDIDPNSYKIITINIEKEIPDPVIEEPINEDITQEDTSDESNIDTPEDDTSQSTTVETIEENIPVVQEEITDINTENKTENTPITRHKFSLTYKNNRNILCINNCQQFLLDSDTLIQVFNTNNDIESIITSYPKNEEKSCKNI
jgi:hypothetical protein